MGRKSKKQIAAEAAAAQTGAAAPAVASNIVLTPEQSELLGALNATQRYIAENCAPHIAEEQRLRALFVASVMPTPIEGTVNIELGGGWRCKVQTSFKRAMDRAQFGAVFPNLPTGTDAAVINWLPQLVKAGYDALAPEHRAILDQCITTKPSAPSVRVVAPGDGAETVTEGE